MNHENINNSNLDGMSLASFCQSRAVLPPLVFELTGSKVGLKFRIFSKSYFKHKIQQNYYKISQFFSKKVSEIFLTFDCRHDDSGTEHKSREK